MRKKNENLEINYKKITEENQTLRSENRNLKKEIENIHKVQSNSNTGVNSDPQSTGVSIHQFNKIKRNNLDCNLRKTLKRKISSTEKIDTAEKKIGVCIDEFSQRFLASHRYKQLVKLK